MLTVEIDSFGIQLLRASHGRNRALESATIGALNLGVGKAHEAARAEMLRVFDRPTPWVLRSLRTKNARAGKLEATVGFDIWGNKQRVKASQSLWAEVYGGVRALKRHEVALQRIGVLPKGMAVVPGPGAKIDQYGNQSAGEINQILSWFGGFGEQGYRANMTAKGRERLKRGSKRAQGIAYFAIQPQVGGLAPGIYRRTGSAFRSPVTSVMLFVPVPSYRIRFDFYKLTQKTAEKVFGEQFPVLLDRAIAAKIQI
jgi:hypothetical protein